MLAREHERQEDVVLQRERVEQVEILKHEAEVLPAERGDLLLADARERAAVQPDLALRRAVERRQNVEQRRLAGAGLAHDRDVLAALHRERDIGERLHAVAAEARRINFFQTVDFQYSHF